MELYFTSRFLRSVKKLHKDIQEDVINAVDLFRDKKNHEKLKLHKLHGKSKGYHAFSANFSYRVIVKQNKRDWYCIDVGTHEIYE
jgi:mRNA-degrading endonuclease YafQ of YafQ-DinJ toxin-antitoxin module